MATTTIEIRLRSGIGQLSQGSTKSLKLAIMGWRATMLNSAKLQAAEHVIEIRQFKFVPSQLEVRPGDTIKWVNRDIAPHTATAMDRSWDTKLLKKGESISIVVTNEMKLKYFCRFHPHMKATLVVDPN